MIHETSALDDALTDATTGTSRTNAEQAQPIPFLAGRQIYLTRFTRQHLTAPDYHRWLSDLSVVEHLDLDEYRTPVPFAALEAYYEANAAASNTVLFAVHERETDRFVGTAKLGPIKWIPRRAEMGLMLGDQSCRGKGYGTEVIRLVVEYAFTRLNLQRVAAGLHEKNVASLKAFLKAGFVEEGRLRNDQYVDGAWCDAIRVGILRQDETA